MNSGPHPYHGCALPLSYRGALAMRGELSLNMNMVLGVGFEPTKALSRQIYSLLRLTASLPQQLNRVEPSGHYGFTQRTPANATQVSHSDLRLQKYQSKRSVCLSDLYDTKRCQIAKKAPLHYYLDTFGGADQVRDLCLTA